MIRAALVALTMLVVACPTALGRPAWMDELAAVPMQDGGRVMPLETYARRLAVKLTGRTGWSEGRGPEVFRDRDAVELLVDLIYRPQEFMHAEIVAIENRPFKEKVGLDPMRKFFSPMELSRTEGLTRVLDEWSRRRQADGSASPGPDERRALEISSAVERIARFSQREPLPIVPAGAGEEFLRAGPFGGDPGTEPVQRALAAFGEAYLAGEPLADKAREVRRAVGEVGDLPRAESSNVRQELFYNSHQPWRKTAIAYGLSIVAFGFSRLFLRRPLVWAAVALGVWGVVEHMLGLVLRTLILDRVPVANTFESLLWMGLVAIVVGLGAQGFNRRSYYLFGGVCAAFVSVLFAALVPLQDQTNSLPAVLRSNFWLVTHVLTIVASYGILLISSVLGHVYLVKHVLVGKRRDAERDDEFRSAPLIVQTYRTIQIGLVLLTAGTILGGVWAADSWGRFWGWDPKETWALISIVIYFAVLHARHIRWIQDFGLAASAILGFMAIVWTFYGVNYVMATGLHSYGFGSGGEVWVALWAIAEIVFLVVCRLRYMSLRRGPDGGDPGPEANGGGSPSGAPA